MDQALVAGPLKNTFLTMNEIDDIMIGNMDIRLEAYSGVYIMQVYDGGGWLGGECPLGRKMNIKGKK